MKRIATTNAPAALGPYAQAVDTGDTVYCSGQLGLDPATGALAEGVQAQTHQALKNLQAVLQEAGLTLDNVVKTTVFVQDLGDFGTVNEIYGSYFHGGFPARSCVQIAALPKGALVEIVCFGVRYLRIAAKKCLEGADFLPARGCFRRRGRRGRI